MSPSRGPGTGGKLLSRARRPRVRGVTDAVDVRGINNQHGRGAGEAVGSGCVCGRILNEGSALEHRGQARQPREAPSSRASLNDLAAAEPPRTLKKNDPLPGRYCALRLIEDHAKSSLRRRRDRAGLVFLAVANLRRTAQGKAWRWADPVQSLRQEFAVEEGRVIVALSDD